MRPETASSASLVGAVVSAIAASACCVGPLAFAMLGLGGAGFLLAMEPYRSLFTVITVLLLGIGFYTTYRPSMSAAGDADGCECEMPRTTRAGRWMLWGATGAAGIVLISPSLIPLLF